MTSRREIMQKRLNVIWIDMITDVQSIIEENIMRNESKENLNKIFKQESFKVIEELKENVD